MRVVTSSLYREEMFDEKKKQNWRETKKEKKRKKEKKFDYAPAIAQKLEGTCPYQC